MAEAIAHGLTRRWLPVEEWPKLAQTELATFAPHMDPSRSRVVVIEQDGEIVACWGFFLILHAEGLWKKDGTSNRTVWRLLSEALHEAAADEQAQAVMTGAADDTVRSIVERHHGQKLPDQFVLPVPFGPFLRREASCQP
jgi:hypothetical protein